MARFYKYLCKSASNQIRLRLAQQNRDRYQQIAAAEIAQAHSQVATDLAKAASRPVIDVQVEQKW